MRRFMPFLFLLLLGCAAVVSADRLVHPLVLLEKGGGHGSGFVVSRNFVLTAGHVLAKGGDWTVRFSDGQTAESEWTWRSARWDVGLIKVDVPSNIRPATLDCTIHPAGTVVTIVGHPGPLRGAQAPGMIAVAEPDKDGDVAISGSAVFGSSGGPVYHDGRVIGLLSGLMPTMIGPGMSISGFVYMTAAERFCREVRERMR